MKAAQLDRPPEPAVTADRPTAVLTGPGVIAGSGLRPLVRSGRHTA